MTTYIKYLKYIYLLVIISYVLLTPFTKVEESFNLQAMHDHLEFASLAIDLDSYDHLEFSGVVPRSFIGSILVSIIAFPGHVLFQFMGCPKLYSQYLCRIILGLLMWLSTIQFVNVVESRFGRRSGCLLLLLHIVQFHLPFYATRPLPNTFALILVYLAYSQWFQRHGFNCLLLLGSAIIVFRCDIMVLFVPIALTMLLAGELTVWTALPMGSIIAAILLTITVLIDSYFWKRLLWAEGSVLFFNTVMNKSSEWGVMAWHWYFSSALPRSLHMLLPFAILGLAGLIRYPSEEQLQHAMRSQQPMRGLLRFFFKVPDGSVALRWYYAGPVLAFVGLYSLLPHKELRFIFPALPMLTWTAAMAIDDILPPSSSKIDSKYIKLLNVLLRLFVCAVIIAAMAISILFTKASFDNYPGGRALFSLLRKHLPQEPIGSCANHSQTHQSIKVHIDVAAAMTGVSRFSQEPFATPSIAQLRGADKAMIIYSKTEGLTSFEEFDWLLTEDPQHYGKHEFFEIKDSFPGFSHISLSKHGIKFILKPNIYILKRKRRHFRPFN